jgi:acyl-CoA thioesterase FadM
LTVGHRAGTADGTVSYATPVDHGPYTLIDDVVAPSDTQTQGAHVIDYEIQKLLSQGWQKYLAIVRDAAGGDIPDPAVRQITTSFDGECHGGDELQRGVRAVERTRRSWVIEEALWNTSTKQLVARSRVVMAGIDRSTGRAAEVAPHLWAAVEAFEGRTIEPSERRA